LGGTRAAEFDGGSLRVKDEGIPFSNAVKCGEVYFVDRCKLLILWLLR
jgi:hypothetical protein